MRGVKRLLKVLLWIGLFTLAFIVFSNVWIVNSTQKQVFSNVDSLPGNNVAVVLGTSKKLASGASNPYFEYRIKAAADLYNQQKIRHIIVSGDNRTVYYNEPIDMLNALIELGVPEKAITLDYAGLRTLDSIVRAKEIFGQENITIVTQKFHTYRAIFISNFYKLDANAYAAGNLMTNSSKLFVREILARPKAILDLYVFKKSPKFLGEKEELKIN